jgi:hypothetical protein
MDERDYQFMNQELNMETFKLDKTKLKFVRQQDRVKGNWYVVLEDVKSSSPWIVQWHSTDRSMDAWGTESVKFNFWFAIPPNLPGFPQSDLPDIIKLPLNEWSYSYSDTHIVLHRTKRMQPITIPSGTKAEQIEAVRKLLNELQTKPNE